MPAGKVSAKVLFCTRYHGIIHYLFGLEKGVETSFSGIHICGYDTQIVKRVISENCVRNTEKFVRRVVKIRVQTSD